MKSKLLSIFVFVGALVGVCTAQQDCFKVMSEFTLQLDCHGHEIWKRIDGVSRPVVIHPSLVAKDISSDMIRAFRDFVGQDFNKTAVGADICKLMQGKTKDQSLVSNLAQAVVPSTTQKDYSSLLASFKTKVKPNTGILALNAVYQEARFYAKMQECLRNKALSAPVLAPIAHEAAHAEAWTKLTQRAATSSVNVTHLAATTKVVSKVTCRVAQPAALAAGRLVAAGATAYGAQKAYNYVYPKQQVQETSLGRVKLALGKSYSTIKANCLKGL